MLARRPVKTLEIIILIFIVLLAITLNTLLLEMNSAVCTVQLTTICTQTEWFEYVKWAAYTSIGLALLYSMYIYFIHLPEDKYEQKLLEYTVQEETTEEEEYQVVEEIDKTEETMVSSGESSQEVVSVVPIVVQEEDTEQYYITEYSDDMVVNLNTFNFYSSIINFKNRKKYRPGEDVQDNPGYFLQVDNQSKSTNRFIHEEKKLPATNKDSFCWVKIEEKNYVVQDSYEMHLGIKPGSKVNENIGYYIEISALGETIDRICYSISKLPPTTSRGHRWVFLDKTEDDINQIIEEERKLSENLEGYSKNSVVDRETFEFYSKVINFRGKQTYKPGHYCYNEPGYFLELDQKLKSTNRFIYSETKLPPTYQKGYSWVRVEQHDTINRWTYSNSTKLSPGTRIQGYEGYYLELDTELNSVDRICYCTTQLPPTRSKGHKWVFIEANNT